jgi:hypothetical protein
MGAAGSIDMEGSDEQILKRMLPAYYVDNVEVTEENIIDARSSWDLVTKDTSPEYISRKQTDVGLPTTCLSWFYDRYISLFF